MDRKWMNADRLSQEYEDGVKEFIRFAVEQTKENNLILCPCWCCLNIMRVSVEELEEHLMCNGIDTNYTCWTKHGETRGDCSSDYLDSSLRYADTVNTYEGDRIEEIPNVVEEDLRDCPQMFERLKSDAERPLYNGCTKFTRLAAVLKLYNLKATNGWSDKSFTDLLSLLSEMLPEDNVLPSRTYEAKQMLCSIGLTHERIHACPNDCILFRNEYASLKECPKCNASRYKKKESTPAKVVWYFPIIPRFRRMYRSAEDAKHLTWHADE